MSSRWVEIGTITLNAPMPMNACAGGSQGGRLGTRFQWRHDCKPPFYLYCYHWLPGREQQMFWLIRNALIGKRLRIKAFATDIRCNLQWLNQREMKLRVEVALL